MKPTKTEVRLARCAERVAVDEGLRAEALKAEIEAKGAVVTRRGLAVVLKVSVRTVDEMVAKGEITPMRPGGVLVRFYLPDVVRQLTAAAVARLEKLKGGLEWASQARIKMDAPNHETASRKEVTTHE